MKFAVVVFPGSNCDHDAYHAIGGVLGREAEFVWHGSADLAGADAVILPGGFAYGDYLRTGAIARFSPVMSAVAQHARAGGLVLGVCNGFQVLLEAGLLPGAMLPNAGLRFICRQVHIRVETTATPFTAAARKGQVLRVPIAHGEGNYVCDQETLRRLEREDRIVFRYTTPKGETTREANPNGSLDNIAGILNEGRNVMGMMPHPERAAEAALGSDDGLVVLRSMAESLARAGAVA